MAQARVCLPAIKNRQKPASDPAFPDHPLRVDAFARRVIDTADDISLPHDTAPSKDRPRTTDEAAEVSLIDARYVY
ncbi:hypothetical protein [Tahibacter amnicola]|uniref:Uncharacterized protein n=1 Tax=Tahibacter amnicola TaxID=2976241 RepID=A0ABY6BIZ6_9GAMM|nr:hypothetical protein [Tahibacter amnicola]UXI69979.1 hypothetical protein N4264_10230 [Tahibacter amnicola]